MEETRKTASKKDHAGFWQGIKSEYSKILWPTKDSIVKQSIAVIVISVIIGLLIVLFDNLFGAGMNFLTRF